MILAGHHVAEEPTPGAEGRYVQPKAAAEAVPPRSHGFDGPIRCFV